MEIPEDERGSMRTYTIRDLVGSGAGTRIVVDIVVHDPGEPHLEQRSGPGNEWALRARPGDRLIVMAPRVGHEFGGIEWSPGEATRLLLAGDETAVPAVRGVLRDLPADAVGAAFLEVPTAGDIQRDLAVPAGIDVTWLPRGDAPRGASLHAAVIAVADRHRGTGTAARRRRGRPGPVGDPGLLVVRRGGRRDHPGAGRRHPPCRALRLDRRRVQDRHRPAAPARQRARDRPRPGRVHGLLARGRRHAVLSSSPGSWCRSGAPGT